LLLIQIYLYFFGTYRNYTKKRAIDSLDEIEKLLTELLERLWDDIHDYKALIDSVNDAVNKFRGMSAKWVNPVHASLNLSPLSKKLHNL